MKTKRISRTTTILFGFSLLCAVGSSVAGPFPGLVNIRLSHGFPHANAIDFHYYPNANVYFSFSTGNYYYPSHGGWQHSRVLPRHLRAHLRERQMLHREYRVGRGHYKPRRHHERRDYGHRGSGHRDYGHRGSGGRDKHGWDQGQRQQDGRGDRHRSDRREGGDRHRG